MALYKRKGLGYKPAREQEHTKSRAGGFDTKTVLRVFLKKLWQEEDGQDLVEYSLLVACLALSMAGVLSGNRTEMRDIWSSMNTALSSATIAAS